MDGDKVAKKNGCRARRLRRDLIIISVAMLAIFGVELSAAYAQAQIEAEAYQSSWQLDMDKRQRLVLDLSAVELLIETHDGDQLEVAFEGERKPSSSGEMPEILLAETETALTFSEEYNQQGKLSIFGMWSSGEIKGRLTVRVPQAHAGETFVLKELSAATFSGDIAVSGLLADSLVIEASSGDIRIERCDVAYGAAISTFSGAINASNIRAETVILSNSSGSLYMENVASSVLCRVEGFSGHQSIQAIDAGTLEVSCSSGTTKLEGVRAASADISNFSGAIVIGQFEIEGLLSLKGSSGDIQLLEGRAAELTVEAFSGNILFTGLEIDRSVVLDNSAGMIIGTGLSAGNVEVTTFSGAVNLDALLSAKLMVETSSGDCAVTLAQAAPVEITTFSGDITVILPPETAFEYSLETFSGKLDLDIDNAEHMQTILKSIAGQVGEGGSKVMLDSSSGDICVMYQK